MLQIETVDSTNGTPAASAALAACTSAGATPGGRSARSRTATMRLPARGGVLGAAGKAERLSLRVALRVQLRALSGDRAKLGRVARLERGQQLRDVVLLLLELGDPL